MDDEFLFFLISETERETDRHSQLPWLGSFPPSSSTTTTQRNAMQCPACLFSRVVFFFLNRLTDYSSLFLCFSSLWLWCGVLCCAVVRGCRHAHTHTQRHTHTHTYIFVNGAAGGSAPYTRTYTPLWHMPCVGLCVVLCVLHAMVCAGCRFCPAASAPSCSSLRTYGL